MASTVKASTQNAAPEVPNLNSVCNFIIDLSNPITRENALTELSRWRENIPDLAVYLWFSQNTIVSLLQEIISVYPYLNPPTMTTAQSNRVCSALSLFQNLAADPKTRLFFLRACIPIYIYPFLQTTSRSKSFEYLRLTSLGVIGAMVKFDDTEVISFLLASELIPFCLKIMEMGSELSRTVAAFIMQKIMQDDTGLNYICQTYQRFSHVAIVLGKLMLYISNEPSVRLLKPLIKCYARLTDNPRACEAMKVCVPDALKEPLFFKLAMDDPVCIKAYEYMKKNLEKASLPQNVVPQTAPKQSL